MTKRGKITVIVILIIIVIYVTAFIICNQVYIKNVFDEIYYSEMHPALLKYTPTTLMNLRGVVRPSRMYYEDGEKSRAYRSSNEATSEFYILLSTAYDDYNIVIVLNSIFPGCRISNIYQYSIKTKTLTFRLNVYSYDESKQKYILNDDLEDFLKENNLTEVFVETQKDLKLQEFLNHWFDMNNGLSRFNLDDLGDFTIEYEY